MVSKKKTFQFIALKKLPLPSSSKRDKDIFDEGSSYLQPTFCFLNPILIVGRLTFVKFYLIFNNICIRAKCGKISFNKFPCVLKYIQFGAKLFVCFNDRNSLHYRATVSQQLLWVASKTSIIIIRATGSK